MTITTNARKDHGNFLFVRIWKDARANGSYLAWLLVFAVTLFRFTLPYGIVAVAFIMYSEQFTLFGSKLGLPVFVAVCVSVLIAQAVLIKPLMLFASNMFAVAGGMQRRATEAKRGKNLLEWPLYLFGGATAVLVAKSLYKFHMGFLSRFDITQLDCLGNWLSRVGDARKAETVFHEIACRHLSARRIGTISEKAQSPVSYALACKWLGEMKAKRGQDITYFQQKVKDLLSSSPDLFPAEVRIRLYEFLQDEVEIERARQELRAL